MDNQKKSALDVTPEELFLNRRQWIKFGAFAFVSAKIKGKWDVADSDRKLTDESLATGYNNFYEFSLDKKEVKEKVQSWKLPDPWKIEVSGLVEKPRSYTLEELINLAKSPAEERIYRFRCVEAWSMVVPWTGIPLRNLIEKLKPNPKAKYIQFTSYFQASEMPGARAFGSSDWPYTEGLRLDEAMNELSLLATGLYGKALEKQNGAPVRLVVPWKYGFKNIKSISKIEFVAEQPKSFWMKLASEEYGFYANVNPEIDHPRWTQKTERVLDGRLFPKRIPTLKFNGYEKEVAALYKDMDLKKNF